MTNQAVVAVQNSSEATYAVDALSRRWVRKEVTFTAYEPLLAEAIGYLLGRELGVPMPNSAVAGEGDHASWLSEWIPDVIHWDRTRSHLVTNMDEFGRTLALDAILHNEDRHAGNILLQVLDPLHVQAWAIDNAGALCGFPDDFEKAGDSIPETKRVAGGLPVSLMRPGALAAAESAARLDSALLQEVVEESCEIAGETKGPKLVMSLRYRLDNAVSLTERYLKKLGELP